MKKKKKKRKIRIDRIFIVLLFLLMLGVVGIWAWNLRITNLYIHNNTYLTDQEIIEKSGLQDYPSTLQNPSFAIAKKLERDTYIQKVTVEKYWFTQIHITVYENRPLFYYEDIHQTVLLDGTSVDTLYTVPTVLNYITDQVYSKFVEQMGTLELDVLTRISEIQFVPNEVDESRFLLAMSDGNYVYINLQTFEKLNKYISILENLPKQNGILYLDYGNNFEILK